MKVTADDLSAQFDALMSRRKSPEEVEAWAAERLAAEDSGTLTFDPPDDEPRLWDAILFLLGVGVKISSDEYLHSVADFEQYRRIAAL